MADYGLQWLTIAADQVRGAQSQLRRTPEVAPGISHHPGPGQRRHTQAPRASGSRQSPGPRG